MDLTQLTYWELQKVYMAVGIEMMKRSWWLLIIVAIIMVVVYYKIEQ